MNKKCILILPYFGKFKNYFEMFLKSCSANDKIDWLIISDQECPQNYKNIKWKIMEFFEFKRLIQNKFDFDICLETPYKLCDYKPSYGYVLEEYIREYEYWGHCDCDLIFGNLNELLVPLLNAEYDKLFTAGHLTLYRNTRENNRRFMNKNLQGTYLYKIAFSNKKIFGFDEDCYFENVHTLFQNDNCKLYEKDLSFNVSPTYYNIFREYYNEKAHRWGIESLKTNLLIWNGKDINSFQRIGNNIKENSYLYIHLHMRKMRNSILPEERNYIKICPQKFEHINNVPRTIDTWKREKKVFFSIEIIKRFLKKRYYVLKSFGKSVKNINPYDGFNI